MSSDACRNILVRGVNWIGDAVMTLPALRDLKLSNPEAKITLLVKPLVAPLFEKNVHYDEIIYYEDKHKGIRGKIGLSNALRGKNFCMAILFQNAFDAAVTAFLAGIPERIGYNRDGRGFLLTKSVKFDENARRLHHIYYYLNLLQAVGSIKEYYPGYFHEYSGPWIYLSLEERLSARNMLAKLKRPIVGINPGATYGSSKRWYPERFAGVGQKIINELSGSVVIFGGSSEIEIAEDIQRGMSGKTDSNAFLNLAGKTSLRKLAAIISECDLLLTNDSGPMHIGYAVGTPLIAIFGSTSPEHTGPARKSNIVIKKELGCSPCFERKCAKDNLKCMELISEEEVFEAIKKLLKKTRAVFFDRDGTLCRDANYLNRMEDFEIFSSVSRLGILKDNGFSLIGVTNQSGIARGIIQDAFVKKVNNIFIDQFGFEKFYYCPHHPEDRCSCRKPEPGLLIRARDEYNIDLKKSFVVGDKDADMLLAKAVGAKGIFVRTGQGISSEYADHTVQGLTEAIDIIIGNRSDGSGA